MIAPARVAAFDVLRMVNSGRADLPAALARVRMRLADERDRALAGEIATGTLRFLHRLDHVIAAFSRRSTGKLDVDVLDILRLTAFQLLHLDRIPASAAVNDAVQLTRRAGRTSAAGLVNAVLRRISRERRQLPLPARPVDAADRASLVSYLSIALSHPEWLAARWLDRYGFDDTEKWMAFDNTPAALTLRANTLHISRDELAGRLAAHGVETGPARFAPDALVVRHGNPLLTPLAGEGLFLVQDEASQLVALLTRAAPGERVLDACASPGGKATAMAAQMTDRGLIVATDVRGRRVDLLARTVAAARATSIRVVRADASAALPFDATFDCVLLDAPCSGLGTLRRDPDIKWRRTPEELPRFAAAQSAMLRQAARVVKPGGRLVYSTCSSEPEENEDAVVRFLEQEPGFQPAPLSAIEPRVRHFLTSDGWFRTFPFRDELEAFFAAMLVKTKDLR